MLRVRSRAGRSRGRASLRAVAAPPPSIDGRPHRSDDHQASTTCRSPRPPGCEDEARAFYGGLLGLEEIPKPAALAARGGCWFRAGAQELHVGVEEPFAPARKAHPGLVADDLDALAERLRDAGHERRARRRDPRREAVPRRRPVRQPARDPPGLAISCPYGHAAAAGVLRGGRAQVVLPGRRAARRHPAGGEPPGAGAREAARHAAPRPLGPPRRADGGRRQAVPLGAAAARARGGGRQRARRRRDRRARRDARDRRVDRARRRRSLDASLPVRRAPSAAQRRAVGLRHAVRRRAGRRPHARARCRRRGTASPRCRVRAVPARHDRPRLPARASVRGPDGHARRPAPGRT